MLDRLIGSRLQHADPKVRIAALSRLDVNDPLLVQSATIDAEPAVRRAALERLLDLDVLLHAAESDTDAASRELAANRLRDVLAAPESQEPSAETRAAFISSHSIAAMAAVLAEHAAASTVRGAALAQVNDEAVLIRIASHDATAELRHAALDRVHGEAALAEIEHATRSRDHGVSRAARTRLQAMRTAQSRHDDAEGLCARMETLAAGTASALDEAAFHRVEQQWRSLEAAADPDVAARYARTRERFQSLLAQRARARQARSPLQSQRLDLLAELQRAAELDDELARRCAETLGATQAAWDAISDDDPGETQRFIATGLEIEAQRRRLLRVHQQAQPMRELVAALRARAQAEHAITRSELAALEDRAQRTPRPADAEIARGLDHELAELLERLRRKQRRENEVTADALSELEAIVADIEGALTRGELAAALPKYEDAQRRLHAADQKTRASRSLRQRMHQIAPRLQELRDWKRWGVEQTRTSMCVQAEGLVGSEEPPEQLARRIRTFRNEWQELDRASGTTSKALWERFDRACTAAYAPCAAYFAAQRETRAANLQRKETLIGQLEALDRDTDWATADWRSAERAVRAVEREWRTIGPVDRSIAKSLAERHEAARRQLEQRFDPRREGEVTRRKALIAELSALAQSDQLSGAAARVRDAQAQWAPAVSAPRKVEQALWTEFRAACDAVYARLHAVRNAAAEQQRAATQAGAAVVDRIDALAQTLELPAEGDATALSLSLEAARTQLAKLRREYSQAPRPQRGDDRQLNARFKDACARAERAIAARREALGRLELEACAARARLCREVEHHVLNNGSDAAIAAVLEDARQAWLRLPHVGGGAGEAIERRFAAATEAAAGGEQRARLEQSLAAQTEEKRRLCLRFEIVAGVPSPAAYEGARLSYRAQWMQDALRGSSHWPGTEREKLEEARRIEARWHALGASPQSEDESLEARYLSALAALRQSTGAIS
jgi:hypothetical protein